VPGVENEIDRLFGLPLDEFTKARNDLARQLKRDGDSEGAAAVQELAKPTVAAWTVNQLARTERVAVGKLLEAGEALRAAQGRLLGGEDASDALREATVQERETIRGLTHDAEQVLASAGRTATQAVLERVAATLRAAAVSDEGRELLESGRLTTELEPAGFGGVAGAPAAGRTRPRAKRHAHTVDRKRQREEEQQLRQELRRKARELERAARGAEREAERAAATAEEARRRAERARAEADAAASQADSRGRG
jgi:hypothetical protein